MKKIKSIKNLFGEEVNLEGFIPTFVKKDYVLGHYDGYGFKVVFAPYDGYTIELED